MGYISVPKHKTRCLNSEAHDHGLWYLNYKRTRMARVEEVVAYVNFHDLDAEYEYEFFVNKVEELIEEEFGSCQVNLVASNSNWRGQTGYATADNIEDLMDKVLSFGSDEISFKYDDTDGYYFRISTHDRPMGFNIYVEKYKE